MKTILVDAINTLVLKETGVFESMYELLETFPNRKIVLTNANDDQIKEFSLKELPYEIFTLKHNPNKTDPEYYRKMLFHYSLKPQDVICFEHNPDAVKSAESVEILTYFYDKDKRDLNALNDFLRKHGV